MSTPLVSIIVNVYNGERYIEECLESILRLDGQSVIQVIVTDDGSTDATPNILNKYKRPPFEVVRFETNVGAAAAINHAFSLVRGCLVARIDYDDRYHPHFLRDSVAALERHPAAAFVCAAARMINQDGTATGLASPSNYKEQPGCSDRFRSMLTRHFVTAPTILGRTSHWRRAIPVPLGMNFCDWYMNLTMAELAPVVVLEHATADYRVHPGGMHTTKIRNGMGERITFDVVDRFLFRSVRSGELAPHANSIMALHFIEWGDKYFGAGMDIDAMRCYRSALALELRCAWNGRFLHRMAGLIVGRGPYERIKRIFRRGAPQDMPPEKPKGT